MDWVLLRIGAGIVLGLGCIAAAAVSSVNKDIVVRAEGVVLLVVGWLIILQTCANIVIQEFSKLQ